MVPVNSTDLTALGHDRASSILAASFHDGSIYAYPQVPEGLYQRLLAAQGPHQSVGKLFHALVKPKFKAIKIKAAVRKPKAPQKPI